MNLLLDTTVQIDRLLSSEERKKVIQELLGENELFSSTYVLGEYYNLVDDFCTLYALFLQDRDISKTGVHITEKVFGRSQPRMQKLFSNIIGICDYDIDLIQDTLDNFLEQIIGAFTYNLNTPLLNGTDCERAKRQIIYEDEVPVLSKVKCRKNADICDICNFWKNRERQLEELVNGNFPDEIKEILKSGKQNSSELKGNHCKSIGDIIICLEAMELKGESAVCSTNRKDFKPICDCLNLQLQALKYGK